MVCTSLDLQHLRKRNGWLIMARRRRTLIGIYRGLKLARFEWYLHLRMIAIILMTRIIFILGLLSVYTRVWLDVSGPLSSVSAFLWFIFLIRFWWLFVFLALPTFPWCGFKWFLDSNELFFISLVSQSGLICILFSKNDISVKAEWLTVLATRSHKLFCQLSDCVPRNS